MKRRDRDTARMRAASDPVLLEPIDQAYEIVRLAYGIELARRELGLVSGITANAAPADSSAWH